MEDKVKLFLKKLEEMPDFNRVKFVFLFGSYTQGKQNKMSDIDFAVYYEGDKNKRFKFRLKLSVKLPEEYDIQIFQDLPVFVRKEVLKGKLIYKTDIAFASDKAYETIKEFDSFKKYYYDYIKINGLRLKKKDNTKEMTKRFLKNAKKFDFGKNWIEEIDNSL